jgi:hypothetical protein
VRAICVPDPCAIASRASLGKTRPVPRKSA